MMVEWLFASLLSLGQTEVSPVVHVVAVGEVREVSGGPAGRSQAVLTTQDEKIVLRGAHPIDEDELRRLSGMKIEIRGLRNDPRLSAKSEVLVERYEIIDVGGKGKPKLGMFARIELDARPHILFVEDDGTATALPPGWTRKLDKHVGARGWMFFSGTGSKAQPVRFGILRASPSSGLEPAPEPAKP